MPQHQPALFAEDTAVERPPDRSDLVDRLPVARRSADRVPCTFTGRGLTPWQWGVADSWFNVAAAWREELGSDDYSRRYNRAVLAAVLRHQRPKAGKVPEYCIAAARAGIERIVWERTGRVVKLRTRVRPFRVPVPLFVRGIFQTLLL